MKGGYEGKVKVETFRSPRFIAELEKMENSQKNKKNVLRSVKESLGRGSKT